MSLEYKNSIIENNDYKKAIKECNEGILKKHSINYENVDENSPLFFRRPEGLEESIWVCKEGGISYENDYVFRFNAEYIHAILEVCRKYNIEFNNFMLDTTPSRIAENATYIEENYGLMYRHLLALVQESERVREVFHI